MGANNIICWSGAYDNCVVSELMSMLNYTEIVENAALWSRVIILSKFHKWVGPNKLTLFPHCSISKFSTLLVYLGLWNLLKITALLFHLE